MKNILFLIAGLFVSTSYAEVSYSMPALEVGFKWNSMDIAGSTSDKQSIAFQLGGSTVFNVSPQFGVRTGLFYSERTFKTDTVDGKITYAEVPVHFMFKLEDYAGIYLGPSVSLQMGDECSAVGGCNLSEVESMVMPITLGAQFKFMPNFGLNLFFESISGDLAQGVENSRAIGINALLTFD